MLDDAATTTTKAKPVRFTVGAKRVVREELSEAPSPSEEEEASRSSSIAFF